MIAQRSRQANRPAIAHQTICAERVSRQTNQLSAKATGMRGKPNALSQGPAAVHQTARQIGQHAHRSEYTHRYSDLAQSVLQVQVENVSVSDAETHVFRHSCTGARRPGRGAVGRTPGGGERAEGSHARKILLKTGTRQGGFGQLTGRSCQLTYKSVGVVT